ncbi:septum formation protein Maf [bacterium]|nr:septum formation protein Maf [bacterium]
MVMTSCFTRCSMAGGTVGLVFKRATRSPPDGIDALIAPTQPHYRGTGPVWWAIIPGMEHSFPIVLASASPRRRRLLEWLGLPFDAAAVETPESLDSPLASDPAALAVSLAQEKAAAVRDAGLHDDALVLTFDTIVALGDRVLGKPTDVPDAWDMLRALSGGTHQVHTGCSISLPGAIDSVCFSATTDVEMHPLSTERIEEWMAAGEFMGCAGAYNIEGQVASVTVEQCYQNVAGLPLCHLYAALRSPGIVDQLPGAMQSPVVSCDAALCRTCLLGPRITRAD